MDDAGYDTKYGSWGYFLGKSKWNRSIEGWAGHTNASGVRGSVEETVEKLTLHSAEEVIDDIDIWTMTNKFINIKNIIPLKTCATGGVHGPLGLPKQDIL